MESLKLFVQLFHIEFERHKVQKYSKFALELILELLCQYFCDLKEFC